ncbi:MAG: hypothetical protein CM15mP85_04100 [Rhodobacterales bacterium]|nr:MAG: hypothetical protein CM15mP85_04100 [Rhodobacterales bacterium]
MFYLITLSIALFFVHYSKIFIKGQAFQSVSDSIYLAHKFNNETDVKVGMVSTIAAFFSASGGASIGQYGPLVHFGTTIGAWLKKKYLLILLLIYTLEQVWLRLFLRDLGRR